MATYKSSQAADSYPVFLPNAGQLAVAVGVYEISAALSKDDIVEMVKIPANCRIVGGWLRADDLDTGTEELDLDVGTAIDSAGTAADPDALGNLGVQTGDAVTELKPEVGINTPLGGLLMADGYVDTVGETPITVTITAAAKGGGTGTLSLTVLYTQKLSVGA